jgi:hypothetical protein
MSTCEACGSDLQERDKDTMGHYRSKCMDCINAVAASVPPHHETCTIEDCPVCDDYARD